MNWRGFCLIVSCSVIAGPSLAQDDASTLQGPLTIAGAGPTAGSLVAQGGKVESVVMSQEYPYFVISTPAPDVKLYFCALSVDEAFKFYDYRLDNPPTSIGSRCSQIR